MISKCIIGSCVVKLLQTLKNTHYTLLNLIILDMVLQKAVLTLILLNTHSNIAFTNYYSHNLMYYSVNIMSFLVKHCRIYIVLFFLLSLMFQALQLFLSLPAISFSVHCHWICCSILRGCVPLVRCSSVLPDWGGLVLLAALRVSACHLCVALCCFGVGLSLPVGPLGRHQQLYTMQYQSNIIVCVIPSNHSNRYSH